MGTDDNIPQSVRASRWEADFHPGPDFPTQITNTQRSGEVLSRLETWIRVRGLGQGAFGQVWLEKANDAQQPVAFRAVKEIKLDRNGNRRRECISELEALSKFSKKKFLNVFIGFYGWYESPDALFIATEYCQHGDLNQLVKQNGKVSEPHVQTIVHQVLRAIAFMHQNDFAHCDLKPGNVLVSKMPPNDNWHIKLCDMGLSKRIGTTSTPAELVGTHGFIAPERVPGVGPGAVDINPFLSDIWSLGAISFFLLTGSTAFANPHDLRGYVNDTVRFPQQPLDGIGAGAAARDFIKSLMSARPGERPPAQKAESHLWMTKLTDPEKLRLKQIAGSSV
ncbi:kinase-like domain-containing protein [Poronia punctata]|nr:kinase-like domain-containing protein [Poronia punctata]